MKKSSRCKHRPYVYREHRPPSPTLHRDAPRPRDRWCSDELQLNTEHVHFVENKANLSGNIPSSERLPQVQVESVAREPERQMQLRTRHRTSSSTNGAYPLTASRTPSQHLRARGRANITIYGRGRTINLEKKRSASMNRTSSMVAVTGPGATSMNTPLSDFATGSVSYFGNSRTGRRRGRQATGRIVGYSDKTRGRMLEKPKARAHFVPFTSRACSLPYRLLDHRPPL